MSDIKWQRKDNWVGSEVDEAFVMLDFVKGEYLSLNHTAARIWDALEAPSSRSDIVSKLTDSYEVTADQCAAAVDKVLGLLEGKGLIQQAT